MTTSTRDDGRALIEVVFLAVLLLIPTVYIMIGALRLQSSAMAVTQAARDLGRYLETATAPVSIPELTEIASIALTDQHVPTSGLHIGAVAAGVDCDAADSAAVTSDPGAIFDLCVTAVVTLPGIPTAITGSRNTVTGVYAVHVPTARPVG